MTTQLEAYQRFAQILDWLINLQERHSEALEFGLIHICFHDRMALGSAYGAQEAAHLLDDLLGKLQTAFRKTDLVARIGGDFWVLVPYTTPTTVMDKVRHLVDIASENGLNIVEHDVAVFSLPDPEILAASGQLPTVEEFLAHLKAHRDIAFRWMPAQQIV